ncbi:unnamed protein product [Calypogeia fissa]
MTSRAVKLTQHSGKPEEIYELVTEAKPRASPGHVVVRMTVMPVNPKDLQNGAGGMWLTLDLKDIYVGAEGTGVVEEVGDWVTTFSVGQRVIPLIFNRYVVEGFGVWRDYVEIPEADLITVPVGVSDEVAAQFFITPWLVYGILKEIDIPKGGYLVSNAAGSVVGRQLVQLAKHWDIKTINVVRRDEQIKDLKDLGADEVINSSTEDVFARVKEITGGKLAHGVVDPIAGGTTKILATCVRNGGKVFLYGRLSSNDVILGVTELVRQVSLRFFMINDLGHDPAKRKETVSEVFQLLRQRVIEPAVGKTFPLKDFKEAIIETQKPGRVGKVLLINEPQT